MTPKTPRSKASIAAERRRREREGLAPSILASVYKLTHVGDVTGDGTQGPAEAAMQMVGIDMDNTVEKARGELTSSTDSYEFTIDGLKFTIEANIEAPPSDAEVVSPHEY